MFLDVNKEIKSHLFSSSQCRILHTHTEYSIVNSEIFIEKKIIQNILNF